jgi:hypothetical protein
MIVEQLQLGDKFVLASELNYLTGKGEGSLEIFILTDYDNIRAISLWDGTVLSLTLETKVFKVKT